MLATVPSPLAQYDDHAEPPDLIGERHAPEIEDSNFSHDLSVGIDVVIWTMSKQKRPWVGRVVQVLSSDSFKIQWYQRRTKSRTFFALKHKDSSPNTTNCDVSSVMFWAMGTNKTDNSFDLSEFWLKRITHEYSQHDQCYDGEQN